MHTTRYCAVGSVLLVATVLATWRFTPVAVATTATFSNSFDSQSTGALVTGTGSNSRCNTRGASHLSVENTTVSSAPDALTVTIAGGGRAYAYKQYRNNYTKYTRPPTNAPTAVSTPRPPTPTNTTSSSDHAIKTVFLIVMENQNWSSIKGNPSAPYINNTLLPMASRAEQYYNPPGLHPGLGDYLWLESGQCFTSCGTDNDPSPFPNGLTGPALHSQLSAAGISWRGYFEGMTDGTCPMATTDSYAVDHNPFVYYNDVSSNPQCPNLQSYADLSGDPANSTVARYNVIVPDLCDDMHDPCAPISDPIKRGDTWLQNNVPAILSSPAYKNGGALFITWDEGEHSTDGPIGMIVLSPYARGGGYANTLPTRINPMLQGWDRVVIDRY